MAGEKQIVWTGLLEAQKELAQIDQAQLPEFIDRFDVHHRAFEEVFGRRSLLIKSIGSFILSSGNDGPKYMREPEEKHYLADDASVFVYVPKGPVVLRTILLSVDAEAVTTPSVESDAFEPLFQRVNIPVTMVTNIAERRAA